MQHTWRKSKSPFVHEWLKSSNTSAKAVEFYESIFDQACSIYNSRSLAADKHNIS